MHQTVSAQHCLNVYVIIQRYVTSSQQTKEVDLGICCRSLCMLHWYCGETKKLQVAATLCLGCQLLLNFTIEDDDEDEDDGPGD